MPGNPARGLDTHQGTVTLFDGEIGVPVGDPRCLSGHRGPDRGGERGGNSRCWPVRTPGCWRSWARACRVGRIWRRCTGVRAFEQVRVFAPPTRTPRRSRRAGDGRRSAALGRGGGARRRRRRRRDQLAGARARAATGSRPACTSTPSARACRAPASSTPRLSRRARCSATAASRCATRRASILLAVEQGAIAGEEHVRG